MTGATARRHWPFLTRRQHRSDAPPAQVTAGSLTLPSRHTLDLSTPAAVTAAPTDTAPTPQRSAGFAAVRGAVTIDGEHPTVRLSALQSAIGSLRIDGGATALWETSDRTTGVVGPADPLAAGSRHANRPLIERVGSAIIISLRHVHDLRRLVIEPADRIITVATAGEATITVNGTLYLHHLGGILELRAEPGTTVSDYRVP
ncbi:hypothetical protein [Curtobacterium sp. MCBD17_040]|uniref:hypothetical protein n=1 Tax=Curtobacterium sp. MCBD17_040 TaxID=2175674 RepID=UPI000DA9CFC2|nr:hypothetical protein [Curtobacterium sp. MCBD17_040]WIB65405.1 hypothetical protein DEI94_18535 [Curtobacterium sp. MCBD17_040]